MKFIIAGLALLAAAPMLFLLLPTKHVAEDYGLVTGNVLCMQFGGLARKVTDTYTRRGDEIELSLTVVCNDGSWISRSVTNPL